MSNSKKKLTNALNQISFIAERLQLPEESVDRAKHLFKQLMESNHLRKRLTDVISTNCLYIACRQEGATRTFKEICAVSKVGRKVFWRCYKLCLKVLEINVIRITTGDFMSRFCDNLKLPITIQNTAAVIAKKAEEMFIFMGRSPLSIAAAAIYIASKASEHKRSVKEISEGTGVSVTTIRNTQEALITISRRFHFHYTH